MGLTLYTGNPIFDALGTLLIGVMLGFVAVYLVVRNREFLVGRSAPDDMVERFSSILNKTRAIESFHDVKSRMQGAEKVRFKAEIDFDGQVLAERLEGQIELAWPEINDYESFRAFCGVYAEEVVSALGDEIDDIESRVKSEIPQAHHVDLETD